MIHTQLTTIDYRIVHLRLFFHSISVFLCLYMRAFFPGLRAFRKIADDRQMPAGDGGQETLHFLAGSTHLVLSNY